MLKIVNNERLIEHEREKLLLNCKESEERKRMSKQFGTDRSFASARIIKFNK